ncbi:MAG: T9SS type A sorting domain-containing protein [Flavobacteriales bacterium]|nr:T9SS type A sorting domain-containing protein [Flavobacteriales bacterium]
MRKCSICTTAALLVGYVVSDQGLAQGLNNLFVMGYSSDAGLPLGGTNVDFIAGVPNIYYQYRDIGYSRANANISDSNGDLLFSTNGAWVADALGDTMQNGTGLSPSFYTTLYPEGLHVCQTALIIPVPAAEDRYLIFHCTIDDQAGQYTRFVYYTEVDMSANSGLGTILSKNNVLLVDILNVGKLSAVRHANGRDWWVTCIRLNTNVYLRYLVTPNGIEGPFEQSIGVIRHRDSGQVCFAPAGDKFAYYYGAEDDLEIFDFDRCTGMLSNPVHIAIDDYNQMGGVAFSPSGQFLYVSSVLDLYQYDVTAGDIAGSMVHLGTWDGFFSPSPPFATVFDIAQVAPDGKIYISTGNSTLYLHLINEPDQPGLACGFEQHAVELPTYNFNSLPNHPNYHLGPVDGSVCDSLGITTGISPERFQAATRAGPNPNNGSFALTYPAQATAGVLEVLDVQGRVVYKERLPQWSTIHNVQLEQAQAGMYHCRLQWGVQQATVRVNVSVP